jgi:ABC-type amino acid transport substrate-binding protein
MKFPSLTRTATLVGVLAVSVSLVLTGCTPAGNSSSGGAISGADSRLAAIQKAGVLKVGMTLKYEPQMFRDKDNKPAGYDVDLVTLMAKDLGVKLDIEDQEFEALVPGLLSKKFDLISVGLVNTPERAKTMWFSSPYVPYNQVLLGNSKYPASTTAAELDKAGVTITALTGSTAAALAKRTFPKAKIVELDEQAALLEVSSGRADATVVEEYLAKPYIKANPGKALLLNSGKAFSTQYGAYALPKGDVDWQEWVNNWLAYRTAEGYLDTEYAKWIEPTFEK